MRCDSAELLAWNEKLSQGDDDLQMLQTDINEDAVIFKVSKTSRLHQFGQNSPSLQNAVKLKRKSKITIDLIFYTTSAMPEVMYTCHSGLAHHALRTFTVP